MAGANPLQMLLASQGMGAISNLGDTFVQAQAMRAQARFGSKVAGLNAEMANLQAEDAINRGNLAAGRHMQEVRGLEGAQRAAYAAQGLAVGQGSPAAVMEDTRTLGAADASQIRLNAYREAFGYRREATGYASQARIARANARTGVRSTLLGGGIRLLRDAAGMAYASGEYGNNPKQDERKRWLKQVNDTFALTGTMPSLIR